MGRYKIKRRKDWSAKLRQVGPSLRERNVSLLDAVDDIFGISQAVQWRDVKRNVTADRIKRLYQFVSDLWPPSTNLIRLLPAPDHRLKALYLGDVYPELIVRNVFRFGLYADQIFIIDPFHTPWSMGREVNPIERPEEFKEDTLKLIYFATLIDPWVREGLVTLVPNPGKFDPTLFQATRLLATERIVRTGLLQDSKEDKEVLDGDFSFLDEEIERSFLTSSPDIIARFLKEAAPDATDEEIAKELENLAYIRDEDPLAAEGVREPGSSQILVGRGGANLETALFLSQMMGAFPYTNLKMRWREILSVNDKLTEDAKVWSPLTKAFQSLDFRFLDNVDSNFACEIRAEGRLEDFRAFLRRLWKTVNGGPDLNKIDTIARDFRDELTQEYHKAEAEWSKISQDLTNWAGGPALATLGVGGIAAAIATGNLTLAIPSLGFIPASVLKLVDARTKRKQFRKTTPMSVFIDLSKKGPKNR